MRLTCPRCGAQYEIANSAIPATGREVECSACSHVWRQPGLARTTAPYDPDARPALNRPLNESILSILREETARELGSRMPVPDQPAAPVTATPDPDQSTGRNPAATANAAGAPPDAMAKPAPDVSAEPDAAHTAPQPVPESTAPVDLPPEALPDEDAGGDHFDTHLDAPPLALPDAAELAATLTRPGPPLPEVKPEPLPEPAEPAEPATEPEPEPESAPKSAHEPAAPAPSIPPPTRRAGYASGFGLAAMLALGVVTVYTLAPRIQPAEGGGLLAQWRQEIDQTRLWLHDRFLGE